MAEHRGKYGDIVCYYYNTAGGCWFGSDCYYWHKKEAPTTVQCRFYRTPGGCRYGNKCMYSHDPNAKSPSSTLDKETDPFWGRSQEVTSISNSTSGVSSDLADFHNRNESQGSPTQPTSDDILSPIDIPTPEKDDIAKALDGLELTSTPNADQQVKNAADNESDVDELEELESCCPCTTRGRCTNCVCAKRGGCTDLCENDKCLSKPAYPDDPQSKKKRKAVRRMTKLKCGRCPETISTCDIKPMLTKHYREQLLKLNSDHLRYFKQQEEFGFSMISCRICSRSFEEIRDFMQHMKSKLGSDKEPDSQALHTQILDTIVTPFVDNDLGELEDEDMKSRLMLLLLSWYDYEDDTKSDLLKRMRRVNMLRGEALERETKTREYNFDDFFFDHMLEKAISGELESNTSSDIEAMREDMEYELLCQGIKPWDSCAGAALSVLYGGDDFW